MPPPSVSATHARTSTISIKDAQSSFVNSEDSSLSRFQATTLVVLKRRSNGVEGKPWV